jgi:hypothetical protein
MRGKIAWDGSTVGWYATEVFAVVLLSVFKTGIIVGVEKAESTTGALPHRVSVCFGDFISWSKTPLAHNATVSLS